MDVAARSRATISGDEATPPLQLRSSLGRRRRRSRSAKRSKSYLDRLRLYCRNSTLVGLEYLVEPGRSWFERIIWAVIHATTFCVMAMIVASIYREYEAAPVVTTVDTEHYPINLLDFPAIAVCTINRISRNSAEAFARKIVEANVSRLTFDEVLDSVGYLGNLYSTAFDARDDQEEALDSILTAYHDGQYNVEEMMKSLTPRCSDVLRRCHLLEKEVDCEEIFDFRRTQDGYCCVFNYVRSSDDFLPVSERSTTEQKAPFRTQSLGMKNGLTIVMDPLLDDYFYPILPIEGWKLTIFNSRDYPDDTSGGVTEVLIPPSTENHLTLDAVSFYSTRDTVRFPVGMRGCIFYDELHKPFAGYTYSDCVVNCKAEDAWKTCGCRPFFFPNLGNETRRVCDIGDAACLRRHKVKWWNVFPHEARDLPKEIQQFHDTSDSNWTLHCDGCYPSCEDISYNVQISTTKLKNANFGAGIMSGINSGDCSVVHVYFKKFGTLRLRQHVVYEWYELLSNIGGICGVFVGFSLISVVELIYFLLLPLPPGRSERPSDLPAPEAKEKTLFTVGGHYRNEFPSPRSRRVRVSREDGVRRD